MRMSEVADIEMIIIDLIATYRLLKLASFYFKTIAQLIALAPRDETSLSFFQVSNQQIDH